MKRVLNILKWAGIVLTIVIIGIYAFVQIAGNKKFDADYPDIKSSNDPEVIARGKYLAFGPAHCASCHVPMDKFTDVENGLEMPLIGGWEESIPGFGAFRAPNLTPDKETGIGNKTDAALARSIRYMVGHDNRIIFPFMSYQEMSDEDLSAVISFLRSQPEVHHTVAKSNYGFLAKALIAFGLFKPEGPQNIPSKSIPIEATPAYGKYLAYHIANCKGCHTEMDMNTGKYIGAHFAGKGMFPPNALSEEYSFITPNLTPHPTTGVMADWSEDAFIARFRGGRIHKGTPMPWGSYSRMNEVDLKALYSFLQSLDPVENKVEKTVYAPGEELPGL